MSKGFIAFLAIFLAGCAAIVVGITWVIEWAWNAVVPVIWHGPAINDDDAIGITNLLLVFAMVVGMLKNIAKSKYRR